CQQHYNTPRTF
nr:immunoglobulin light chain junction region [Mus musculus]NSM01558.1 immunoglobulin light chain junction region [Mus musculus]NSM02030.1 immunoglobulin light chain junction region [Mus musculus]